MMLIPKAYRSTETVEAVQLTEENALDVALWVDGHVVKKIVPKVDCCETSFEVQFKEPVLGYVYRIEEGQWLIRPKSGTMRVANDEDFKIAYDESLPISYKGVMVLEDGHDLAFLYTNHDDGIWLNCHTCGFELNMGHTPSPLGILQGLIKHKESLHE